MWSQFGVSKMTPADSHCSQQVVSAGATIIGSPAAHIQVNMTSARARMLTPFVHRNVHSSQQACGTTSELVGVAVML